MKNLLECLSPAQQRGLSELLGFDGATPPGFLSVLRTCAPLPGVPLLRDALDAYLDAVRERAGA